MPVGPYLGVPLAALPVDYLVWLVTSELDLRERVTALEEERDVLRFWWEQTLHALADVTAKHQRRHEDHQRLEDELRDLRAMAVAELFGDAVAVTGLEAFRYVRTLRNGSEHARETAVAQ